MPSREAEAPAASPSESAEAAPGQRTAEGAAESAAESAAVRVWFTRGEEPVPVERRVEGEPVAGALEALVRGPTAAERSAGLTSWFSAETAGTVRSVRQDTGHVVVEFEGLRELIPNASSSAGSQQLLTALNSTLLQFPAVRSVEYRLDGSCAAFWEWLQRECEIVRRDR